MAPSCVLFFLMILRFAEIFIVCNGNNARMYSVAFKSHSSYLMGL